MKLIAYFLVVAVLVAIIGGIGYYTNSKIKHDISQVAESSINEVKGATEMAFFLQVSQTAVQELIAETYRKIIEPNEAVEAEAEEEIKESLQEFAKWLAFSRKSTEIGIQIAEVGGEKEELEEEKEELKVLDELEAEFETHKEFVSQYLNLVKSDIDNADEFLEETLEPHFREKLLPLAKVYEEGAGVELTEEEEEIEEAVARANVSMIIITIVAILFSIALGLFVSYRITKPLEELSRTVDEVSKGNFKVEVKKTSSIREINSLADSLSRIMTTMKFAVKEAKGGKLIKPAQKEIQKRNS